MEIPQFSEGRGAAAVEDSHGLFLARGAPPPGLSLRLEEGSAAAIVGGSTGASPTGRLRVSGVDRAAQEDARRFDWSGPAAVAVTTPTPLDLNRELTGQLSLVIAYRVDKAPTGAVSLVMRCGEGCRGRVPVTRQMSNKVLRQWGTLAVPLSCFAAAGADLKRLGAPFVLSTDGAYSVSIADVRIASVPGSSSCASLR